MVSGMVSGMVFCENIFCFIKYVSIKFVLLTEIEVIKLHSKINKILLFPSNFDLIVKRI